MSILNYKTLDFGLEEFILDVGSLYPSKEKRSQFENHWEKFYLSDPFNSKVFKKQEDKLIYISESWIPIKKDNRPPISLLFGNPAPHSVVSGMYFAYEGKGREHRVWKIFRDVSLLNFKVNYPIIPGTLFGSNELIKEKFYQLDYESPFRIGMAVYFSIPSPPSDILWSGVGGLHKLFGKQAIKVIESEEQRRISKIIPQFIPNKGGIIAFQKDAYNGAREVGAPEYSLNLALEGKLESQCKFSKKILVAGVPPTRFLLGGKAKESLKNSVTRLQKLLS